MTTNPLFSPGDFPHKLLAVTLACILAGCTTIETQRIVLAEPMSEDVEARVLRETGISGAAIGGLAGAAAGFGAGYLAAIAAGADSTTALLTGAGMAAAGGVGGAAYGYGAGKRQGEKIVASAMNRDQLAKLLQGARAYNARLSKVNSQLRKELATLRARQPGRERTATGNQISRLAIKEINEANKRIAQRQKALGNPAWAGSQKSEYKRELITLIGERNRLVEINNAAAKLASQ